MRRSLATTMVTRDVAAYVPSCWVTAESVCSVGDLEMMLRRAGKGYVPNVHAHHRLNSWSTEMALAGEARDIAAALPSDAWTRLSAGHGTKGERLYDWTYCALDDLDVADTARPHRAFGPVACYSAARLAKAILPNS